MKYGYIYILTNKNNTTLYIGVTSDLINRIRQHKSLSIKGFTKKYKMTKLVYYEQTQSIESAIEREKQLKAGSRKQKLSLIESINSQWNDLYPEINQT